MQNQTQQPTNEMSPLRESTMGPERIFFFFLQQKNIFLKISKKKKYNSEDEPLSINKPFLDFYIYLLSWGFATLAPTPTLIVMVAEPKTRLLGPWNDKSYTESNSYIFYVIEPEKAPATNRSATIKAPRR